MTQEPFQPKSAEQLKSEIIADLGVEYEGNEETIDKLVARELKAEEFKASLHADKKKHLEGKEALKQRMIKAGLDPETGEKLSSKEDKGEDKTSKNDGLSLKDVRALQDVHDEDVEEVVEFAKYKGISIAEAKQHQVIKTLLKTKSEERASAQATNTATKKTVNKVTDESILQDFEEGKLPSDDEGIRRLAEARMARKKAIRKGN